MNTKAFLSVLAVITLLLACTSEADSPQPAAPADRQPILFAAAPAVTTRAGQDLQNTQFLRRQDIDVQITAQDGLTVYDMLTYYTANTSGAMVPKLGVYPYYPTNKSKIDIRAFYPTGYLSKSEPTFSVRNPQINDDDYMASDLMFASLADVETPTTSVTHVLDFHHLLTKIQVNLTGEAGVNLDNCVVTLMGIKTSTTYNTLTGAVSASATGSPTNMVIANDGSVPSAAIIPPQQLSSGYFIEIALANNDVLYYSTAQTLTFESGKVYTFNINVVESNITVGTTVEPWASSTYIENRLKL